MGIKGRLLSYFITGACISALAATGIVVMFYAGYRFVKLSAVIYVAVSVALLVVSLRLRRNDVSGMYIALASGEMLEIHTTWRFRLECLAVGFSFSCGLIGSAIVIVHLLS